MEVASIAGYNLAETAFEDIGNVSGSSTDIVG